MKKRYILLLFITQIFFIVNSTENIAQVKSKLLYGKVIDKETRQPLPYAIIRKIGSTYGTMSNNLGYYNFLLEPGRHEIVFSYLGYRSDTIITDITDRDIRLDISLIPSSIVFPEIMVSADRYNPAERIILKAIANKKKFFSDLKSYEFEAYTKTVMRAIKKYTDKDSADFEKEINISQDTAQINNRQDTIIAGITETQINGYWKEPDQYKEEVTARKQTANFQSSSNILTVGRILNLNEDKITLGNNLVVGPTAPNALDYYDYEMIDTISINNLMVFKIKMSPKHQNVPLFNGIINIVDSTFSIIQSDITINQAVQIPFVDSMQYRQQFSLYEKKYWLPISVRLNFRIRLFSLPPMFLEQTSILHKYKINNKLPDNIFDEYEIKIMPYADNFDSSKWYLKQMIPLTDEETKSYVRIDSIMTNMSFIPKMILGFIRMISEPTNLPMTDLSDFIRYNRVEGTFLGIGLNSKNLFDKTRLELKAGYGISSKDWKYSFGIEQDFPTLVQSTVGFSYYKKLNLRDDWAIYDLSLNSFLAVLNNFDYYDYYFGKGWQIYGKFKPIKNIKAGIEYSEETQSRLNRILDFGPLKKSEKFRENPAIDDGKLKSIKASINYDNRKLINSGSYDIPVTNENTFTVQSNFEFTDKNFLNSDFKFFRGVINLYTHQLVYGATSLNIFARAGFSSGELPLQKIFDLPSAASGLSSNGVFRTLEVKEFLGDRYASLFLEYNFGNSFFRSLNINFLKDWDLILNFSGGWTGFSSKSKATQLLDIKSTDNVFYEAGFGFGNIFPFMRLDFTFRLSHRYKNEFMVTVGSLVF